jgi:hypothetical protein
MRNRRDQFELQTGSALRHRRAALFLQPWAAGNSGDQPTQRIIRRKNAPLIRSNGRQSVVGGNLIPHSGSKFSGRMISTRLFSKLTDALAGERCRRRLTDRRVG